jgi:hypothetical protein
LGTGNEGQGGGGIIEMVNSDEEEEVVYEYNPDGTMTRYNQ